MVDMPEPTEHERALVEARREGGAEARRHAARRMVAVLVSLAVLSVAALGVGWTVANRAHDAAPEVIEEIAAERRAALEARLAARASEAQTLAHDLFSFLQRVWHESESLRRIRTEAQAASTELGLLTDDVTAAFDSPTTRLAPLLENGPTRARAVLDHGAAVVAELQRLVPAVLGSLNRATTALEREQEPPIPVILHAMDELLEPFIGTNAQLAAQWETLKNGLLEWVGRVEGDFEAGRRALSGDELSAEFMRRLAERIF